MTLGDVSPRFSHRKDIPNHAPPTDPPTRKDSRRHDAPRQLWDAARGLPRWLKDRNYSAATIQHRRRYLNDFIDWAEERSYTRPAELTRHILERYQRHLAQRMNRFGKPLSFRDQGQHLGALRAWYRWLVRQRYVIHNLARELELPRLSHPLPKYVPNRGEVEEILAQPDLMTTIGLRDRAILETFYSTGIRRCELVRLTLWDIDRERGVIAVRMGKGRRDRMVPIGARALAWLEKYRLEARPDFVVRETEAGALPHPDGRAVLAERDDPARHRLRSRGRHHPGQLPFISPRNGHEHARRGCRHEIHSGHVGACETRNDADLHPRLREKAQGGARPHPRQPDAGRTEIREQRRAA